MISLGLNPNVTCDEDDSSQIDDLKMKLEGAERELDEKIKALEDEQEYSDRLYKELEELKNQPVFAPDPEEVVKLKAQVEMLERQNEKILDRLIR